MQASVNPAYCLQEAGTLEAAPNFVYLNQDAVDNPGTGVGQDAWYVDALGKVRVFATNAAVEPAAQAEGNPWLNDTPNAGGQMLNVQSDDDWLKLDTTDSTATATVAAKVTIGRTAVQLIDQALIFGFYNHTTKKFETATPFATGTDTTYEFTTITNLTVTPTPSKYTFYMWYNGESPVAINQNAIANQITATITYNVVS